MSGDFNSVRLRWIAWFLLFLCTAVPGGAQPPQAPDAAQLQVAIRRLNVLGSVLYIAAHPDDENTTLLAYFANTRYMRSAYLSLTRGDGGQNLIGAEQSEELGLIRTQELLAARRIDGAEQYFTRAIDFGYSKSSDEALKIWNRDSVLADIVAVIRSYRPDVIITRFSPTLGGHGHHTASAILARDAFDAAADPAQFPEQLARGLKPWKAARLVFNFTRFFGNQVDTLQAMKLDLGEYQPLLGKSMTELAAMARTMHKSQGFGVPQNRGPSVNYFQHTAGTPAEKDLFDGVATGWVRIPGGEPISAIFDAVDRSFDPDHPQTSIPLLLDAYERIRRLPPDPWVEKKLGELSEVLRLCSGIWIDAIASQYSLTAGETLKVTCSAINRSVANVALVGTGLSLPVRRDSAMNIPLGWNAPVKVALNAVVPGEADVSVTQPYWLLKQPLIGGYVIPDPVMMRRPDNPPPVSVRALLRYDSTTIAYDLPVQYRWVDPVDGELYRPLEITPVVMANLAANVFIFPDPRSKPVSVRIRSGKDAVVTKVVLDLPRGWESMPEEIPVNLAKKGDEVTITFRVVPHEGATDGVLKVRFADDNGRSARGIRTVHYPHIPHITYFPSAEARLVRVDLKTTPSRIGYIMGAGDEIPSALRQLGYDVQLLTDEQLASADLTEFRAIIAGVRAYATRDKLPQMRSRLMEYVRGGGTYLVQYTTMPADSMIGPYKILISRDRVTDERATVSFPEPRHSLLTTPNRISAADFQGWVQERGLYFADSWDPAVEAVLSCHDPGESPKNGGLLYARYGKGVFMYCAYAFFRQLPEGVPGAYRLFVNLLESNRSFYRKGKK